MRPDLRLSYRVPDQLRPDMTGSGELEASDLERE